MRVESRRAVFVPHPSIIRTNKPILSHIRYPWISCSAEQGELRTREFELNCRLPTQHTCLPVGCGPGRCPAPTISSSQPAHGLFLPLTTSHIISNALHCLSSTHSILPPKQWRRWKLDEDDDWDEDLQYWEYANNIDGTKAIGLVMADRVRRMVGVKPEIEYPDFPAILLSMRREKAEAAGLNWEEVAATYLVRKDSWESFLAAGK